MIFVDSGAFYALADQSDRHHRDAVPCLKQLVQSSEILATSILVCHEVWFLIHERLGKKASTRFWEEICRGGYHLLPLGLSELTRGVGIQKKYADVDFGFVDSLTFALCEIHKIRKVFTFDRRHFSIFKPTQIPSFELLPEW